MLKKIIFGLLSLVIIASCSKPQRENIDFDAWGKYWFQGKAELSSFELTQYRYGEPREGEAVLIFVTEDFSRKKQVKLDNPGDAGRDKLSVIKMNQTRDFVTGIYPYHMMLSAFTPTKEQSNGVKFTLSSQEWCGQSFAQLNLKSGESYSGKLFSYFEQEGDDTFSFSGLAEDDIWNLIRIDPGQIPTGSVQMLPSLFYQRFTHKDFEKQEAFVRVRDISENRSQVEVAYSNGSRVVKIDFEKEFPFQIMAWEEEDTRSDGSKEVTKAKRKGLKVVDYWTRNKVEDEFLRKELNLKY
ncbi:hypothetical protein A33Q_3377 [Indibacter alkaliphilus LW1]|uniref:Septum formation inhibitor Maf n=1 Tax=Indibacter alkaliphilus (strain CCUG 57479 / KCTC 22604 / LW1) TaxID=1189612 RepID=S2D7I3_INDAL|nr:hypothetical protein [Indibacter alkaliphilus]EOZ95172.1 hypothetical protein A33Q_3377 [Indibacter alkaliphilus LW1]